MADKKPRTTVEPNDAPRTERAEERVEVTIEDAPTPKEGTPAGTKEDPIEVEATLQDKRGPFTRVSGWVSQTFPGREHSFWGGVCGLLIALFVFAIGVIRTLLIALLVVAGVAVGQVVDGDPKIVNAIRAFIESRNS